MVLPLTIQVHNGHHNGGNDHKHKDDDDDWSMDTSKEAVKARLEDLTDTANALALNDDLEKTPQERLDLFFKFVDVSYCLTRCRQ